MATLGPLVATLGPLVATLEPPGDILERLRAILGPSWVHPGPILALLAAILDHLEPLMEQLVAIFSQVEPNSSYQRPLQSISDLCLLLEAVDLTISGQELAKFHAI